VVLDDQESSGHPHAFLKKMIRIGFMVKYVCKDDDIE
jgi:hypothetical protein